MSRFPIAEAIRSGAQPEPPTWWPNIDPSLRWDWRQTLDRAAFFDLQTASETYWSSKKDVYHLESDFGPLTPPYESMWCEWTVPDVPFLHTEFTAVIERLERIGDHETAKEYRALVEDDDNPVQLSDLIGAQMAAAVESRRLDDGGWLLAVMQLVVPPDRIHSGRVFYAPVSISIELDSSGVYVLGSHRAVGHKQSMNLVREQDASLLKSLSAGDENVIWMALSLLNCKNVTTRDTGVAYGRSGREKRQGVPTKRYHTIVLPGMSAARGHAKGRRDRDRDAITMAAHRVRGHFKTYTAEAPLLGKHVGTYWWGWNVRGSKQRGEVVSDYKV
jgi:hypothetical protein